MKKEKKSESKGEAIKGKHLMWLLGLIRFSARLSFSFVRGTLFLFGLYRVNEFELTKNKKKNSYESSHFVFKKIKYIDNNNKELARREYFSR